MGRWTGRLARIDEHGVVRFDREVLVCLDVRYLVSLTLEDREYVPRDPSPARLWGQCVVLHLCRGFRACPPGTFQEVLDEMMAAGWGRDRVAENLERIAGSLRKLADVFEEEFPPVCESAYDAAGTPRAAGDSDPASQE